MVSYGPGALIFGGHLSNSVEYLYNGTSETLRGRVPRLDSSCAVLSDRDSVIITGGVTAPSQAWEFSQSIERERSPLSNVWPREGLARNLVTHLCCC